MIISDVVNVERHRDRKDRVGRGRGAGSGKTCSKGHRGAKSRAGWGGKLSYEGGQMPLFRTLPRRGFNNVRFQVPSDHVNVGQLSKFEADTIVTPELLREAGIVVRKAKIVKILGDGELTVALTVKADQFSKSAIEKIQAAGGTIEIIQNL